MKHEQPENIESLKARAEIAESKLAEIEAERDDLAARITKIESSRDNLPRFTAAAPPSENEETSGGGLFAKLRRLR